MIRANSKHHPAWLPRSLHHQFRLILTALAVLIAAGSLFSVQSLRRTAEITRELADERLMQMENARKLAETAMLIEIGMNNLIFTSTPEMMNENYAAVVAKLDVLNHLAGSLGADNVDVSVLTLYQAEQNFRNIVHTVVGLRQMELQKGLATTHLEALKRFKYELEHQAMTLVSITATLEARSRDDYRTSVQHLAATADRSQNRVFILLAICLVMAWLISRLFLGRHILSRLNQVSFHLRRNDRNIEPIRIPVHGEDEIGQMARAVELFLEDRRKLNLANRKLEQSLQEIKTLRGILPICSFCKNIRNDEGYYEQIEAYIHKHSGVDFSHTICPECMKKHYPEEYASIMQKENND